MTLDKFELKEKLGSGHFGEVWLAIDTGLNTECAVKFIPKDKIVNQKNFFYEAQILKAAEHANIVSVLDTGHLSDGRIYLSTVFGDGSRTNPRPVPDGIPDLSPRKV
ncbi:MAG: protein kinase [Candidatus Omnitrophota bacterium]